MEEFWEHNYFNTYYYSNIIDNILTGDIELIGFISGFFEDNYGYLKPFEKFSVFHQFIQYIIFRFLDEDMNEYDEKAFKIFEERGKLPKLYAEALLDEYDVGYSFEEFNRNDDPVTYTKIEEYHDDLMLTGHFEELCEKSSHEVFYNLFNNRDLLIRFNHVVAQHVAEIDKAFLEEDEDLEEYAKYVKSNGVLRRVDIPAWCKKAVYFREKGRCCLCGMDISGLLNPENQAHYDHMVPLFQGGVNDVSNIQLLCSKCNLLKGKKDIVTSNYYFKWY